MWTGDHLTIAYFTVCGQVTIDYQTACGQVTIAIGYFTVCDRWPSVTVCGHVSIGLVTFLHVDRYNSYELSYWMSAGLTISYCAVRVQVTINSMTLYVDRRTSVQYLNVQGRFDTDVCKQLQNFSATLCGGVMGECAVSVSPSSALCSCARWGLKTSL